MAFGGGKVCACVCVLMLKMFISGLDTAAVALNKHDCMCACVCRGARETSNLTDDDASHHNACKIHEIRMDIVYFHRVESVCVCVHSTISQDIFVRHTTLFHWTQPASDSLR